SRMVQTLNAQVFAKLWRLIVPEIVYENTCVIVMGSEGRGEQIMRTDQDNALIIRNGFKDDNLADYAEQFNQALAKMGYPLCDGNIMMTNPMWRQPLNKFEKQINTWFSLKDPIYSVYISAILDNAYVCGDERLLTSLRKHLKIAHQNADPMMIRQFARIALQYGEVNQWWQRFSLFGKKDDTANQIDLKKAGIFPIVHGVRAMAMEQDIYHVTSTKGRLKALARAGVISEKRAETLIETLQFFMAQRLSVALVTEDKLARQVNPSSLSALERDLMKECLNMVKGFKNELISHYQLNYG
ncbi:MAG: nucleotidyltransferase, partial [Moraxellaceae bacterium]|nr:nucleotidyltransferase [Moraxellaceae bacterium]